MTQSKAKRTKIRIGGIEVNAYLLPDGRTVKLAGQNAEEVVGLSQNSLRRFYGSKTLKSLPHADLALGNIKADTGESFIPISVEDIVPYWNALGGEIGRSHDESLRYL